MKTHARRGRHLKRRSGVGIGVAGVAAAATLVWHVAGPLAQGHPVPQVEFELNHQRPVAGETFAGLAVTNPSVGTISWVQCDAEIAGEPLPTRQESFYDGDRRQTVVCSWHIPADAGGKKLWLSAAEADFGNQGEGLGRAHSWLVK